MDDAALDLGRREDRLDRLLEARQASDAGDEDVFDPARLQVAHDTKPEVGAFGPVNGACQ
jgi:hypothetical protein